eukprot:scaffold193_cov255-Pinguiococcus_pyrenoidosus.AAC.30
MGRSNVFSDNLVGSVRIKVDDLPKKPVDNSGGGRFQPHEETLELSAGATRSPGRVSITAYLEMVPEGADDAAAATPAQSDEELELVHAHEFEDEDPVFGQDSEDTAPNTLKIEILRAEALLAMDGTSTAERMAGAVLCDARRHLASASLQAFFASSPMRSARVSACYTFTTLRCRAVQRPIRENKDHGSEAVPYRGHVRQE